MEEPKKKRGRPFKAPEDKAPRVKVNSWLWQQDYDLIAKIAKAKGWTVSSTLCAIVEQYTDRIRGKL